MPSPSTSRSSTSTVKLLIAVIGIWFSFIYYGSLQEDITSYTSSSGAKFTTPWFLQLIEASACVLVGAVGAALPYFQKNGKNLIVRGNIGVTRKRRQLE
ncbi:hypothetical protein TrLO_g9257 [Triparma laevis f. longispina]|uniref:Uncharacterized protein n=1 Tax=Triparma laevis f. longispina TaxID=1714387 RepID=A0A9W7FR21_9STRA|nr:hypothetical protein TrLO_g9257 [Triparma laevis f. longispina]